MCELIAANHNCDQAGDLRDRTGKQVLHRGKARVEGRSAPCLRVRDGRHDEKKQEARSRVVQSSKVLPPYGQNVHIGPPFVWIRPRSESCLKREWIEFDFLSKSYLFSLNS